MLFPETGLRFPVLKSTWDPRYIDAIRSHYTGSRGPPPGKKMAWEVLEDGEHRGWLGVGEPPYKLAPRRRLGIEDARPLEHTVLCTIYKLDAPGNAKAGDILKAWHEVAGQHWADRYGWTPEHWETMCLDRGHGGAIGACFRRAGYRSLGWTTGRSARRPAGHTHGKRIWMDSDPKLVLYRGPLARQ